MEREYDYIKVYKKTLFGWIYITNVNRNRDGGLHILHRTRDHYRNQWGYKNVKLVLCWNDEELKF